MPIVIEIYRSSANVFRTAANFMTYDEPCADLLGHHFCATDGEAVAIHRQGAAIFSGYGPAGYKAFARFERFLQAEGLVKPAKGPRPKAQKDRRYRRNI
ncbi:MAG: hypothetical protein EBS23_00745 [Betaproteobacteria bacterium]|nr:hypothetical protein [Betaproteobacteria bacterium]